MMDWSTPKEDKAKIDWSKPAEPKKTESKKNTEKKPDKYHPMLRKIAEQIAKYPNLNKNVNQAAEFMQMPGAFAGGAVQQGGDMFASLANLINKPINAALGTSYHQSHPKIREQFAPGTGNDIAFGAGELAGGLVGGAGLGTGRGIAQGLQRLPRSHGWTGLAEDVAKGAGSGYALGEINDEGEGRGIGAALGGLLQPLSSITNRGITNRVLGDMERTTAAHGQQYDDIFDAARDAGVQLHPRNLLGINGNNPRQAIQRLLERLSVDHRRIVEEFMQNPSFTNAHGLQSDLGIFTRKIEADPRFKTDSLPLNLQRAYEAATETRHALQRDISESLGRHGLINEALQYPQTTQSFAQNVAPYRNKAIGDVVSGQKHPDKLAKRLREDEQFMMDMGHRYPELGLNKHLPKAYGAGLTGGGLFAALLGIPKIGHAEEKEPFMRTENYDIYNE